MRSLIRPRVSPPTLVEIRQKYRIDASGSATFPDGKWNNPDVRGPLYAMHGRICAYCGGLASDARGDVEHFRPKSVYRWLAYEFTNYLIGCRVCNTSRKSNDFPLVPHAKRAKFRAQLLQDSTFLKRVLAREQRLLLDPSSDPIDDWIDVDYESDPALVRASELASKEKAALRRVETTIAFFGLNRVLELVQDRNKMVAAAIVALRKWSDGDVGKADDVRSLSNRYMPHGWAVRRVTAKIAPKFPLPTPEEDLQWLVNQTLDALRISDGLLARLAVDDGDRPLIASRRAEATWTLATLWKDPPATTPDVVERWIDASGRRAEIAPFLNQL